jgi:hypothetical protein
MTARSRTNVKCACGKQDMIQLLTVYYNRVAETMT